MVRFVWMMKISMGSSITNKCFSNYSETADFSVFWVLFKNTLNLLKKKLQMVEEDLRLTTGRKLTLV